ncbi:amidohydrolase family protein [Ruminococcus difficilis]|uniref:Amidohydrolase n=1 Tax=Ruminococcus difficilis TaxID=2763069 RepID=A0A935C3E8_9FIRM|nr:amidohydrolase family protein [Ruminococcus difficilis]MBK6089715.1 amidohydrolase [Ruminococcus difficilis]
MMEKGHSRDSSRSNIDTIPQSLDTCVGRQLPFPKGAERFQIIDSHCHIYPEKIAAKAVAGTDTFYDTVAKCDGTAGSLLKINEEVGIDHSLVQSVATTPKQVQSINHFIAETVAGSNGKLTGLGTLHPDSEDQRADVRHLVDLGLKGVKLHPDIQQFKIDDYRCLKIYELCEEYGLPILMHTGDKRYDFSNTNRLIPILETYTNLTIIGAHMGGWSLWEEASLQLAGTPNLYVDCSSTMSWVPLDKTAEIIRRYGADRVLFGTDYPMWHPKDELEMFFNLGLTDDEMKLILSENVKKIYGLSL